MDRRMKDRNWSPADEDGSVPTWERANLAVLMDIRDELKTLNRLLGCSNFIAVPEILRGIERNTAKPRRKKKVTKP